MSNRILWSLTGIGLLFGIGTFLLPFVLPVDSVNGLIIEDSPTEYLGALFFFLASICMLIAFFQTKSGHQIGPISIPRNLILLGLAAVLFFGAGEEISWGQRLLGFETPETMAENIQGEFTLHNLPAFDPTNEDSLLNMNRLFTIFWFLFGVLIPTLAFYKPLHNLLVTWGVPIAPWLLGYQFLLYYVLSKLYGPLGAVHDVYNGRIVELRETQHALIFFLIGIVFVLRARISAAQRTTR